MNGVCRVELKELERNEAFRYMGIRGEPDETTRQLTVRCEAELLKAIKPVFIYKVFDITEEEKGISVDGTTLKLPGEDIKRQLKGCGRCVLMAATLSSAADLVIRRHEISDMTSAVISDCLASAAVEQVCNEAERIIAEELRGFYMTWRFSPGYGDLPIGIQQEFISVLDAQKRIGLNATENNILTPRKSVTAVIGVSEREVPKGRRGCAICSMKDRCQFRKRGEHCEI